MSYNVLSGQFICNLLLAWFNINIYISTFFSNNYACNIFHFLDARPTPDEQEVWEVVNTVLENSSKVLEDLKNYKGASDEIREVIVY